MKAWQCSVCKYIHKDDVPPEKCPVCGVGKDKFIEIQVDEETGKPLPPGEKKPEKRKTPETATSPGAPKEEVQEPETGFEKVKALILQHHAHPVLVHTPNGLLPVSVALFIMAWLFDAPLLMKAGMINLVFVLISLPPVLYTGYVEWEKKYLKADTLIFKLKIMAAALTTAACGISLAWILLDPQVLSSGKGWVFILVNLIMLAGAGVAGHIGGKLVFKD